jgi:hypothetical protein
VFENGVLRRIFGRKRDEVTGEWRKLHNEVLRDLYSSPSTVEDQVEENEMGGPCSTNGRERNIYIIGGKAKNKKATRKTKMGVGG